jgi:pimeloyl-ACP methyl ester carboxylesterase
MVTGDGATGESRAWEDGQASEAGSAERRTFGMPDGRKVDVLLAGQQDGLPLVLHNGTPGGLVAWPEAVRAAQVRGMRTIMLARPGYEGSTSRPGRLVADVAGDVAAVLEALDCDAFVTAGWSGGGPHALACSVLLRGQCLATAVIAGVAPYRAEGLDWLAGMGPENVREFEAARSGVAALAAFLNGEMAGLRTIQGGQLAAELGGLLSGPDKAVLTGAFAGYLAASMRAAVSVGIAGWRDDDLAFVTDWGFPLDSAGKVSVWQGSDDRMVPAEHGRWLAKHVPGARAKFRRGEGHLTFQANGLGPVLDDLIDLAGL